MLEVARILVHGSIWQQLGCLLLCVLIVLALQRVVGPNSDKRRLPPAEAGWMPWLGVAIHFGKNPVAYIRECIRRHGNIFTLYIAGRNMTFLTDRKFYSVFFEGNIETISFEVGVQQFTSRAFGISSSQFYKYHASLLAVSRQQLARHNQRHLMSIMAQNLQALLSQFDQPEETDLLQWTRTLMFQASLPALFGPRFAAENPDCGHYFYEMEEEFELATTPIPQFLLKKFCRGKKSLLTMLKRLVETTNAGNGEDTMIAALIKALPADSAPNFLVTFLWAMQANSSLAVFWTMVRILSDADVMLQVQAEVSAALTSSGGVFSLEMLQQLPYLSNCIKESLRLHANGIQLRRVIKDVDIGGYNVPAGHDIIVCPVVVQNDPKLWPDASKFNPSRFHARDVASAKSPILADHTDLSSMMFHTFAMRLVNTIPSPDLTKLVGVQHAAPDAVCRVFHVFRLPG